MTTCFVCESLHIIGKIPLKWTCVMRLKYIGRNGFTQHDPFETSTMVTTCIKCAPIILQTTSTGWDFWDAYESQIKQEKPFDSDDWIEFDQFIRLGKLK